MGDDDDSARVSRVVPRQRWDGKGHTEVGRPNLRGGGRSRLTFTFRRVDCEACPLLFIRCVRSQKTGRTLSTHTHESYLQAQRQSSKLSIAYAAEWNTSRQNGSNMVYAILAMWVIPRDSFSACGQEPPSTFLPRLHQIYWPGDLSDANVVPMILFVCQSTESPCSIGIFHGSSRLCMHTRCTALHKWKCQ